MAAKNNVIVIGAGVCGMTVAHRLQQAGCTVTVLESQDYSGGRTLTIEDQGYKIDQGASLLPSSYKEALELAREVGLADELISVPATSATYIDGKFHYMAMDKPIKDFLLAPYLSLFSKLGFIRMVPSLLKYWSKLSFSDLSGVAGADVETAREYCKRYISDEAYDRLINPLLRGMYIENGDAVSATLLLWILRNFSGVSVYGFQNGMQSLANALAKNTNVEFGVKIDRVDEAANKVLITGVKNGEPLEMSADYCVIACDGKDLQKMFGHGLTEKQNLFLTELCYSPIKMVTFMTSKIPKDEALLMMPTQADDEDLALIVMDHLYGPSRAPAGTGMISFLASHARQKSWVEDADHQQLIEFGQQRLKKYFPDVADSVIDTDTRYWERATTVGVPGSYRNLKDFVGDIKPKSRVHYTGDFMVASSVGVAVSTGNVVAQRVVGCLAG